MLLVQRHASDADYGDWLAPRAPSWASGTCKKPTSRSGMNANTHAASNCPCSIAAPPTARPTSRTRSATERISIRLDAGARRAQPPLAEPSATRASGRQPRGRAAVAIAAADRPSRPAIRVLDCHRPSHRGQFDAATGAVVRSALPSPIRCDRQGVDARGLDPNRPPGTVVAPPAAMVGATDLSPMSPSLTSLQRCRSQQLAAASPQPAAAHGATGRWPVARVVRPMGRTVE
jgi:hypothetical protein